MDKDIQKICLFCYHYNDWGSDKVCSYHRFAVHPDHTCPNWQYLVKESKKDDKH